MTENDLRAYQLPDGCSVETVYYGSGTLCISSQAGCRMACPFCASGRAGLIRSLTAAEMHAQVELHSENDVKRVTISGIGEPMENIDAVSEFIKEYKLPVSITTSIPDTSKLADLLKLSHNGVMISLHAGRGRTHKKLIPKAAKLCDIVQALADIWPNISINKRKKIGFNYMLLKGVNDSSEEIGAFIKIAKEFKEATVHLLVCNDVENSKFESPETCYFTSIYEHMRGKGVNVRRANTWRKSSIGGCGTLFLKTVQK